jgi:hypothetical protein
MIRDILTSYLNLTSISLLCILGKLSQLTISPGSNVINKTMSAPQFTALLTNSIEPLLAVCWKAFHATERRSKRNSTLLWDWPMSISRQFLFPVHKNRYHKEFQGMDLQCTIQVRGHFVLQRKSTEAAYLKALAASKKFSDTPLSPFSLLGRSNFITIQAASCAIKMRELQAFLSASNQE